MAGIFKSQGVWSCGFDFLPNGLVSAGGVFDVVNGSNNVNASFARFGGKGIQINGNNLYLGRSYGVNLASHIIAIPFLTTSLPTGVNINTIFTFYDSVAGSQQFSLGYNGQGQLGFYSGGGFTTGFFPFGLIGSLSPTGIIVPGAYNMIEILSTVDPVAGVLQARVNQIQVIGFTGNTRTSANSFVNRLYFGSYGNSGGGSNHQFDDVAILDLTAPAPLNTFLGNGRIQTDGPNADSVTGGLNAWAFTTPAGSDFANAANIPANPAQYDSDAVLNDRMSFRFPALSAAKAMFLNTWISAEQDAAGTRGITPIFRSNAVDQVGSAISLSNGVFTYSNQASAVDPNTGNPWASGTVVAAGACEIGVQTTS